MIIIDPGPQNIYFFDSKQFTFINTCIAFHSNQFMSYSLIVYSNQQIVEILLSLGSSMVNVSCLIIRLNSQYLSSLYENDLFLNKIEL